MRVKVACINWHIREPGVPHAMVYLLDEHRGMVGESYHATWASAMVRAIVLARVLRRAALARELAIPS